MPKQNLSDGSGTGISSARWLKDSHGRDARATTVLAGCNLRRVAPSGLPDTGGCHALPRPRTGALHSAAALPR